MSTRVDYEIAHERVSNFFTNEVTQYMRGDLNRLALIQDDPACTVPESLAVFAVLDLFGFLMRRDDQAEFCLNTPLLIQQQEKGNHWDEAIGNQISRIKSVRDSTRINIEYMIYNWMEAVAPGDYSNGLNSAFLVTLFRNGGAHQFLPKAAGISKMDADQELITIIKVDKGFPLPILNQNRFRNDMLKALNRIQEVIQTENDRELEQITQDNDRVQDLVNRMNTRLDVMLLLDRKDLLQSLNQNGEIQFLPTSYAGNSPTDAQNTVPSAGAGSTEDSSQADGSRPVISGTRSPDY
jgi:hypothetical protein